MIRYAQETQNENVDAGDSPICGEQSEIDICDIGSHAGGGCASEKKNTKMKWRGPSTSLPLPCTEAPSEKTHIAMNSHNKALQHLSWMLPV